MKKYINTNFNTESDSDSDLDISDFASDYSDDSYSLNKFGGTLTTVPELNLKLIDDYIPIIVQIPSITISENINPILRATLPYPKSIYGFHHYIHQSRQKMTITQQFENKKKVYEICNKFDINIDDYENDLEKASKLYFNIGPKPAIISNSFYILWELIYMFDLVNTDKFTSVQLSENNASFSQAIMYFRDKFYEKKSKNDTYYAIHDSNFEEPFSKEFSTYYAKNRFNIIKLASFKDKANLVTVNTSLKKIDPNNILEEQESLKLIIEQLITSINILDKGGNLVLKIFESYTDVTVKLIAYIRSLFENMYIVKPYTSKKADPEKYIICKNFLNTNTKSFIASLNSLYEIISKNSKQYLNDIFPLFNNSHLKNIMIILNTSISNRQFQIINEMVDFINKENYRGDDYQYKRQQQIDASKFWINIFYTEPDQFSQQKAILQKFITEIADNTNTKINDFSKKIDF